MIRRFSLVLAAAAMLAACVGTGAAPPASASSGVPPAASTPVASSTPAVAETIATTGPAAFADRTVLDEKAVTGVELAYKAARTAVELAVDLGRIKGASATVWRERNRKAYTAVQKARTAYRAGNALSYGAAVDEATSLVSDLLSLAGGK